MGCVLPTAARSRTGAEAWGNVDYTLNVDTQKLGLWPGGFLKVSADTGFGTNLFAKSGALCRSTRLPYFPGPITSASRRGSTLEEVSAFALRAPSETSSRDHPVPSGI